MNQVTVQEVFDLALVILRDVEKIESSIDRLLLEVQDCNRELLVQRRFLSEASRKLAKAHL